MFLFFGVASAFYIYHRATGRFIGESQDFARGKSYRDIVLTTPDMAVDWRVKEMDGKRTSYARLIASNESMINNKVPNVFDISQESPARDKNIRVISYPMNRGGTHNQDMKIILSATGQFYIIGDRKCLGWNEASGRVEAMSCSSARFKDFDIYVDITDSETYTDNLTTFANLFYLMLMDDERMSKAKELYEKEGRVKLRRRKRDMFSSSNEIEDSYEKTSVRPIRHPETGDRRKDHVGYIKEKRRPGKRKKTEIFLKDSADFDSGISEDNLAQEAAYNDSLSVSSDTFSPQKGALREGPSTQIGRDEESLPVGKDEESAPIGREEPSTELPGQSLGAQLGTRPFEAQIGTRPFEAQIGTRPFGAQIGRDAPGPKLRY